MNTEQKRKSKAFWRTVGGKDTCKYYMFKNDGRRKRLHTAMTFLKVLSIIALVASVLSVGFFAVMLCLWFLGMITIVGIVIAGSFDAFTKNTIGVGVIGLEVGLWAFLAFTALYIIKFIFEWVSILAETRALKKEKSAENEKYLKIAHAIKKTKICGLIVVLVLMGAIGVAYLMTKGGTSTGENVMTVIAAVLAITALIVNKIYSFRVLIKVAPEIEQVREERRTTKQEFKNTKKEAIG